MRRPADTQRALQAVERLQAKLKERGEVPTEEKLSLLKSVLQSPLFHQILALQKSVQHLKEQVNLKQIYWMVFFQITSWIFSDLFLITFFLKAWVVLKDAFMGLLWLMSLMNTIPAMLR